MRSLHVGIPLDPAKREALDPTKSGWADRHNAAVRDAESHRMIDPRSEASNGLAMERSVVSMLLAWTDYATAHRKRYGEPIGDDGVLGKEWAAIGDSLCGLLNGELGRLDGGTCDAFILNTMADEGATVGRIE